MVVSEAVVVGVCTKCRVCGWRRGFDGLREILPETGRFDIDTTPVCGCRADADRAAARLFSACFGRALPAQAGAVRRPLACAQERRRAHTR